MLGLILACYWAFICFVISYRAILVACTTFILLLLPNILIWTTASTCLSTPSETPKFSSPKISAIGCFDCNLKAVNGWLFSEISKAIK